MQLQIVPLIIVAAYLVGMLIIGFVVGKLNIKDSSDYMLAGRRMGLFMVAFSLSANNIGGGSTTGLAQKAFGAWGMSAIWYVLAASIAMIPLAYFAPKIRKTMAVTIPEVVGRRFGKFSSTFTAVLGVLSLFCLTSSQIAASGTVVATLTGIPTNVALVIAGLVVILYTTFGGMIADQISDLVQFIIILVGLAIATPFVIEGCGGWEAISSALSSGQPGKLDLERDGKILEVRLTPVLRRQGSLDGALEVTVTGYLDEAGEAGIDALMDEEIQRLAWENHGFRTEVSGTDADEDHFGVPHLAAEITQVAAMPSYAAMEKIIAALS